MEQVQLALFDETDDPIIILMKCWSDLRKKKEQINEYTKNNPSVKDLAQLLKNEIGVGGFASPVTKPNYVHQGVYNHKGVELEGTDSNGVIKKVKLTWLEASSEIMEMIKYGTW